MNKQSNEYLYLLLHGGLQGTVWRMPNGEYNITRNPRPEDNTIAECNPLQDFEQWGIEYNPFEDEYVFRGVPYHTLFDALQTAIFVNGLTAEQNEAMEDLQARETSSNQVL